MLCGVVDSSPPKSTPPPNHHQPSTPPRGNNFSPSTPRIITDSLPLLPSSDPFKAVETDTNKPQSCLRKSTYPFVCTVPLLSRANQPQYPTGSQAKTQVVGPARRPTKPPHDLPAPHPLHRRGHAQEVVAIEHQAARPQYPLRPRHLGPALLPDRHGRDHAAPAPRPPLPAGFPFDPYRSRCHPLRSFRCHTHGPWADVGWRSPPR